MGWIRTKRPPKVADETLSSIWEMPSFHRDDRPDHPTRKPLDAFGIPMRQHVERGGLCYEPFSGSGSQIMAGEANGRRVRAMEISPAYVDVAVQRWQAKTGLDAVLDGDGRTFAAVRAERLGAGADDDAPSIDEDDAPAADEGITPADGDQDAPAAAVGRKRRSRRSAAHNAPRAKDEEAPAAAEPEAV